MLILLAPAKRVMSLQDPTSKMSKSATDPYSRILITDSPSVIHAKLKAALTDSINSVSYDPANRPGVANLLQLLSHFDPEGRSPETLGKVNGGLGLGAFKKLVSETISAQLEEVRVEFERVMEEGDGLYLDGVAERGAARAREMAGETMEVVRDAMGL